MTLFLLHTRTHLGLSATTALSGVQPTMDRRMNQRMNARNDGASPGVPVG